MIRVATVLEASVLAGATLPGLRVLADGSLRRSFPRAWLLILAALALWLVTIVALSLLAPVGLAVLTVATACVLVAALVRAHPGVYRSRLAPGSLSLVASAKALVNRRFYLGRARSHGPVFKMAQYGHRVVCVLGLERGHRLLRDRAASIGASPQPFTHEIAGGFLRYMDATTHRRYAPLFRRALARPVVGGGEEVTAAAARSELDRLADACVRTEGGVAPGPYLAPVVEAAALRVLFGLQCDDESWDAFHAEYRSLEEQPLASPLTRAARESLPLLRGILREHQARLASHEVTRVCSLTELSRIDPAMPDDVCLDNLLFAHRLSAANVCSLLTWLLYELGRNPGVIGCLREEIDTPEGAAAAPLVERTIMETLRLNQSEYLFRTVTDEFEFEGFRFPRSWQVRLCVWESHRDPDVFEQPESFDPDRFLGRDFTSAEYSPFGWGAHACNGVALTEMICRTVLVTLVSGFELEVHGGEPAEHGSRHWNHWQPNSDLRLRLVPRAGAVRRGAEGGLVVMPAGVPELTRVDAS